MNVDRRSLVLSPVDQPPGGAGGEPDKPTRADCIGRVAPTLAAIALEAAAARRAQAAADLPHPPAAA